LRTQVRYWNSIFFENTFFHFSLQKTGEEKGGIEMYKRMMVPLDGSELAECVLPHVEAFVKGFNLSDVILVRVVEPEAVSYRHMLPKETPTIAQREADRKSSAKDYLNRVVARIRCEGATLRAEVLVGKAAESLVDYAEKNNIDLILTATHGRSGVTRWVLGSVADKILRSANVPVLMVRAPGTKGEI
jgi:nucleotide-binding universal stress UspA family protein